MGKRLFEQYSESKCTGAGEALSSFEILAAAKVMKNAEEKW
jgi:hypothetical protein